MTVGFLSVLKKYIMSSDNEANMLNDNTTTGMMTESEERGEGSQKRARTTGPLRVLTFTAEHDKSSKFELLSSHTVYDLVDALCKFTPIGYRGNEGPNSHMWDVSYNRRKYCCDDHFLLDSRNNFDDEDVTEAESVTLGELNLQPNQSVLRLKYDYGADLLYTMKLVKVEDLPNDDAETLALYPKKIVRDTVPATYDKFTPTGEFNLDTMFPDLQKFIFGDRLRSAHLFQAGSKQNFGFMESRSNKMLFLPTKPDTLTEWLTLFDKGARIKSAGMYSWHSVVVISRWKLTPNLQKRYFDSDNEPGFTDVILVEDRPYDILTGAFPKIAALAGLTKDKKVKKGWISLKARGSKKFDLVISSGKSDVYKSNAPKGTAYDGQHQHDPTDPPLFEKDDFKIEGLHDLFCVVEGMLRTM